ncbi:phosphoglycolate phosphatase [Pseudosulfitobacter pseudonitzschiae]|uniref:HAD family hydrolase n=1 Tax=Pseudosulfitobacter pseudonitzschiae TaxID=1402135 RepID=A0A073J2H6_9RHOB|nr:HAD-IA family hydrolase [Pseudosulfitobacter pseudonitzschiae]KEJ96818.1 HAD family hydrolase [Pseudosulfitobacter pseudonitzschiae]QKS07729.1 HAD-IA family hydrolase [Pseudosulfitobacter pseudonitzschiae]SHF23452.1 phosphoglycolate phosphatase [Pseudosulfitobacter pseudonitzschiae]
MTAPLRLVIFDVDGTLVDSQGHIVASMTMAFNALGVDVPDRAAILGIVGLSLDVAMPVLAPALTPTQHAALVQGYKDSYRTLRLAHGAAEASPLYPGALAALQKLAASDDILLGVATGKSKRGLDALIEAHGLERMFVTRQCADFHPSKPHPSMIHTALSEAGVDAANAVMVGDTSFDMDMAQAAGVAGIGVTWGYHAPEALSAATHIVQDFDALHTTITTHWSLPV